MKMLGFLLFLLTGQVSFAQETLKLDRASREYDLVIQVQACGGEAQGHDANKCNGSGRVSLYKKGGQSAFQVLSLPNIEPYKDTIDIFLSPIRNQAVAITRQKSIE